MSRLLATTPVGSKRFRAIAPISRLQPITPARMYSTVKPTPRGVRVQ